MLPWLPGGCSACWLLTQLLSLPKLLPRLLLELQPLPLDVQHLLLPELFELQLLIMQLLALLLELQVFQLLLVLLLLLLGTCTARGGGPRSGLWRRGERCVLRRQQRLGLCCAAGPAGCGRRQQKRLLRWRRGEVPGPRWQQQRLGLPPRGCRPPL